MRMRVRVQVRAQRVQVRAQRVQVRAQQKAQTRMRQPMK
jgi:hypothetical protein